MIKLLLTFSLILNISSAFAFSSPERCSIDRESYTGLTERAAVKELGSPNYSRSFQIKDTGDEFTIELWNIYPPEIPANLNVRIWERTWNVGDCRITLWFDKKQSKKISILSYGWHKNTEH